MRQKDRGGSSEGLEVVRGQKVSEAEFSEASSRMVIKLHVLPLPVVTGSHAMKLPRSIDKRFKHQYLV